MKILHILRSDPIPMVKKFVESFGEDTETNQFSLYGEKVDYDDLVKKIFENEKIIAWW
jgi:hypothetical protein